MNTVAPFRVVQVKKKVIPFFNEDAEQLLNDANQELSAAIRFDEIEQWRVYKSKRNQALNYIESLKKDYYTDLLNNSPDMWSTVKRITGFAKQAIPTRIAVDNIMVSSPVKIAKKFNIFFYEKIQKIRSGFKKTNMTPTQVLEKLVPRPESTFTLPLISIKECEAIILKMKSSHSVGFDVLTSRILKQIPDITAVYLTHMINSSIRQGKFPTILKVSRIIPICKPGKDSTKLES